MFDLVQELLALIRELRKDQIDYAVCGGMAMAVHGFTRATEDIDILVEADSLPRIRGAAKRCGFNLLSSNPALEFKNGARLVRLTKTEPSSEDFLILDLLLAGGPNADAWASRHDQETQWGSIRVVSREALKAMKLKAGRPQDISDVQRIDHPDETH